MKNSFFLSMRTGCRAVGVEYDGDLIDIAVSNLRDFRGEDARERIMVFEVAM